MRALPMIYVGTGTDKRFPFPRLIEWVQSWAVRHPGRADIRVQAGITRCPVLPSVVQYADAELDDLLARASAVVVQGGAGGIMRVRGHGVTPIVVPRYGTYGEAADNHQVDFVRWAAARGMVHHVEARDALFAALDRVLGDPLAYRFEPEPPVTAATVARFGSRVDRLLRTGR